MAPNDVSSKAAKPAKKKPRGKPFVPGQDARRHQDGTKSAAAMAFSRSLREIIAEVGNEQVAGAQMTRVELMVRGLYVKAGKGDVSAFNALVERVEGKITQPISGPDGQPIPVGVMFVPYDKNRPDTDPA